METFVRCTNMLSSSLTSALYLTVQKRQNPSLYLKSKKKKRDYWVFKKKEYDILVLLIVIFKIHKMKYRLIYFLSFFRK